MAHKQVLEKSPVLRRMTALGFSESITKEIILPEDNEDIFGRVIEYLYDNYDNAFNFDPYNDSGTVEKLVDMYSLAEKYQLPDIQRDIIDKLKGVDLLKEDRIEFFKTAYRVFQNSLDSNKIFQPYFSTQAAIHWRSFLEDEIDELLEMVESGGSFARAVLQTQANVLREDRLSLKTMTTEKATAEILLSNVSAEKANSEAALFTAQARFSKASEHHSVYHRNCTICYQGV